MRVNFWDILVALGYPVFATIGLAIEEKRWPGHPMGLSILNGFVGALSFGLLLFFVHLFYRKDVGGFWGALGASEVDSSAATPPSSTPPSSRSVLDSDVTLLYLALSSVLGILIGDSLSYFALELVGIRAVIMVETTKPFFGAILGWIFLGEDQIWNAGFLGGMLVTGLGIQMTVWDNSSRVVLVLPEAAGSTASAREAVPGSSSGVQTTQENAQHRGLNVTTQLPYASTTTPETTVTTLSEEAEVSEQASLLSLIRTAKDTVSMDIGDAIDTISPSENLRERRKPAAGKPGEEDHVVEECGSRRGGVRSASADRPNALDSPPVNITSVADTTIETNGSTTAERVDDSRKGRRQQKRSRSERRSSLGYVYAFLGGLGDVLGQLLTKIYGGGKNVTEINFVRWLVAATILLVALLVARRRAARMAGHPTTVLSSGAGKISPTLPAPEERTVVGATCVVTEDVTATAHVVALAGSAPSNDVSSSSRSTIDQQVQQRSDSTGATSPANAVLSQEAPALPVPWHYLPPNIAWSVWVSLLLAAFLCVVVSSVCSTYALFRMPVALLVSLLSTGPLFSIPVVYCVKRERVTARGKYGAMLTVVGVAVLCYVS